MKVLIFCASGATGHELVDQALPAGYIVTAFVRNAYNLRINHNNLSIATGDISDYAPVIKAVSCQDAALCALGAASPFKYDHSVTDALGIYSKSDGKILRQPFYLPVVCRCCRIPQAGRPCHRRLN